MSPPEFGDRVAGRVRDPQMVPRASYAGRFVQAKGDRREDTHVLTGHGAPVRPVSHAHYCIRCASAKQRWYAQRDDSPPESPPNRPRPGRQGGMPGRISDVYGQHGTHQPLSKDCENVLGTIRVPNTLPRSENNREPAMHCSFRAAERISRSWRPTLADKCRIWRPTTSRSLSPKTPVRMHRLVPLGR
jgi:hypothetical protein